MMCQGDSIYDFVDKRDHAVWKSNLTQAGTTTCPTYRGRRYGTSDRRRPTKTIVNCSSDSPFYCRMYRARNCRRLPPACAEHKIIHVSGHVAPPTSSQLQPLFFAVCSSATATSDIRDGLASYNTTGFQSVHSLDMKYREISHNGQFYLGYSEAEMTGRSWYEFLHPDDLTDSAAQHMHVVTRKRSEKCDTTRPSSVVVRQQTKQGLWLRLRVTLASCSTSSEHHVLCLNHILGYEPIDQPRGSPTTRPLSDRHYVAPSSPPETTHCIQVLPTVKVESAEPAGTTSQGHSPDHKMSMSRYWTAADLQLAFEPATDAVGHWHRTGKRSQLYDADEWSKTYSQRLAPDFISYHQYIDNCTQLQQLLTGDSLFTTSVHSADQSANSAELTETSSIYQH